jgi:hypothetical protein
MMDIARLTEKLIRIEALLAGATTAGEWVAAAAARARIMKRLAALVEEEPPQAFRWILPDVWSRNPFLRLLRREIELLATVKRGAGCLQNQQTKAELGRIKRELRRLKAQVAEPEVQKAKVTAARVQ